MMEFPPDAVTVSGSATFTTLNTSVKVVDLSASANRVLYARYWIGTTAPVGVDSFECNNTALLWADKTTLVAQAPMLASCSSSSDLYVKTTVAPGAPRVVYYNVTYVPYDTAVSATTTTSVDYFAGDYLLMLSFILFFVSFPFVAFFFRSFVSRGSDYSPSL